MEALESFKSVEGRLEHMGKVISSKHLYNDNNATNPDAVIAGLKAVHEEYNSKPILICGGTDKQLDLDDLVNAIINYSGSLILLTGTGTDKLKLVLDGKIDYVEFDTIGECLDAAVKENGEVILFSPGFASFSKYFNNEYERNDEFVKCVEALRN
jgi:UDP-N-acetylmuramoylalanine-D-glutamate ligase